MICYISTIATKLHNLSHLKHISPLSTLMMYLLQMEIPVPDKSKDKHHKQQFEVLAQALVEGYSCLHSIHYMQSNTKGIVPYHCNAQKRTLFWCLAYELKTNLLGIGRVICLSCGLSGLWPRLSLRPIAWWPLMLSIWICWWGCWGNTRVRFCNLCLVWS